MGVEQKGGGFSQADRERMERDRLAERTAEAEIKAAKEAIYQKAKALDGKFTALFWGGKRYLTPELQEEFEAVDIRYSRAKADLLRAIGQIMTRGQDRFATPEVIRQLTEEFETALQEAETFSQKIDWQDINRRGVEDYNRGWEAHKSQQDTEAEV